MYILYIYISLLWVTVTVETSLRWRSWLSGGSQLGECRYKFLRRWAQYGIHSGAQGWEINQYQTGWVRASAWSFSWVDLVFFALFFSPHLHLLIGRRSRASVRLAVFSVIASTVFAPLGCGSSGRSWEEMEASVLQCFCLSCDSLKIKRSPHTPPCEKVSMLLRAP